jgi:hypothetical protein
MQQVQRQARLRTFRFDILPARRRRSANMREPGVHHLIAYCLNDAWTTVEAPSFQRPIKCGKCGRRGRWVDVRLNWKEQPVTPTR